MSDKQLMTDIYDRVEEDLSIQEGHIFDDLKMAHNYEYPEKRVSGVSLKKWFSPFQKLQL
jgi:hypothetical protein